MKNIGSVLLFILFTAATANAQIALEGGVNIANLSIKSDGAKWTTKFLTGGAVGIAADILLVPNIYFQPGLFYEMNGCTITGVPNGSFTVRTVTIPLNIEYKSGDKCSSRFFIGAGPYIGRNTSGEYDISAHGKIPAVGGPLVVDPAPGYNYKKVDVGFGINLGYQLKKHSYLRLRYQVGFINLIPGGDADNFIKSSSIGVTLGHIFGGGCRAIRRENVDVSPKTNHWRGLSKGIYSRRPRFPDNKYPNYYR